MSNGMIIVGITIVLFVACTLVGIFLALLANAVMKVDEEIQEMKR